VDRARFLGRNFNLVKSHNVRAILLTLLHTGSLSRVELAGRIGLSSTTITNLTSELISEGIIREEAPSEETERRRVGRPRTMLGLVPDARFAIGVHIGVGLFRVAVTNLHAQILHSQNKQFEIDTPADQVIEAISATIKDLIHRSGVENERVLSIGIGASGLVDYEKGINVYAPRLQWRDLPIRTQVEATLDCPVFVENNVRSMALAEALFGRGQGIDILAFVYGRIGVGAGFFIKGTLFRGSGAGAGEMGHTTVLPDSGELCTCGNTGCLETLVSEPVLLQKAQIHLQKTPGSKLEELIQRAEGELTIDLVFDAARQGDAILKQIIEEQAAYLGIALANLVNVLNPELILLGGMFAQGHDLYLPVVERTLRERAFGGLGKKVSVDITSFGWQAGVIGAASVALASSFYHGS
jgi:glucokinase-like ROK family protein